MLKYIIFDFMGVLFKCHNLWPYLKPIFDKYNIQISPRKFNEEYRKYDIGKITEDQFWKEIGINNYISIRQEFIEEVSNSLNSFFEGLYTEYNKEVTFGGLTNMPKEWAYSFLKTSDIMDILKIIIISGEAGVKKPSSEIYQILIKKCKCDPEEILFIDDKLRNLKSAKEQGIITVYFKSEFLEKSEFIADYSINSLSEVKQIIEQLS